MDQAGLQPTTGVLAAAPREEEDKVKASGSDGSVRHGSAIIRFLASVIVFGISLFLF